jgi:hypothetical protein
MKIIRLGHYGLQLLSYDRVRDRGSGFPEQTSLARTGFS